MLYNTQCFPGGSDGKEFTCNAGDLDSILGLGRSLGGGISSMATHSRILAWRIPMDRGSWWARVHGVTKSRTWLKCLSTEQPSTDNRASHVVQWSRIHLPLQETQTWVLGWKMPWRRKWQSTPVLSPGNWRAAVHWVAALDRIKKDRIEQYI